MNGKQGRQARDTLRASIITMSYIIYETTRKDLTYRLRLSASPVMHIGIAYLVVFFPRRGPKGRSSR